MKPCFNEWIRTSPWPTEEFPGLETGTPGLSHTDMVEYGGRIVAGQTSRTGGIKAAVKTAFSQFPKKFIYDKDVSLAFDGSGVLPKAARGDTVCFLFYVLWCRGICNGKLDL